MEAIAAAEAESIFEALLGTIVYPTPPLFLPGRRAAAFYLFDFAWSPTYAGCLVAERSSVQQHLPCPG